MFMTIINRIPDFGIYVSMLIGMHAVLVAYIYNRVLMRIPYFGIS
jgi:hypothetical protein